MDKVQGIISSAIGRRAAEDAQNKKKAKLQKPKKHSYKKGSGNSKNIRTNPRAMKRAAQRTAGLSAIDRGKRGVTIKNCGKGNDVAGLVGYATLDKKEHKLLDTNCDDWDSFIATTNQLKKLRPDIKNNVQHVAISFRADTNFDLNRLDEMAAEIRKDLGIDDSWPFALVQHFDTADNNPHAHLIWSRISVNGEVHDDNSLSFRCASSEQRMENLYQLDCVPMKRLDIKKASKKEIEMQLRTGELSIRAKFQALCIDAMKDCDTIITYFNRLSAAGFDIEITTQDNGERISGIVYHLNGDTMKASDLGKAFTAKGLTTNTKANITYVKNRDFESITQIQERTALKQFRAAGGDLTDAELPNGGGHGASITASSVGHEPTSRLSSSNGTDIGNRDGQRHSENKRNEPISGRIQPAPTSQPTAIQPDMVNSNPSHQRASDLISDLADATAIATNDKREGAGAANHPATSSNAAAQIAQIKAFGKIQLQLSIMLPAKADGSRPMIKRDFDASNWDKFKGFATAQNAQGGDIYIAPHPNNAEHSFILLDDLTIDSVNQMKLDGLEPAILVESSPQNFQACIKLSDKPLTKEQRLEASRLLTKKYEADGAAVGSVRIGRLAGFTNRKAKHKNSQGLQPYCQLKENRQEPATNGHLIVQQANELIAKGTASVERKKRFSAIETARDYVGYGANSVQFFQTEAKKIFNRYKDETDLSKLDSMVCKTMVQHHFSDEQIAHALREASPDLATRHSVEDYIARTVSYARNYIEMQRQIQESEDNDIDEHTL